MPGSTIQMQEHPPVNVQAVTGLQAGPVMNTWKNMPVDHHVAIVPSTGVILQADFNGVSHYCVNRPELKPSCPSCETVFDNMTCLRDHLVATLHAGLNKPRTVTRVSPNPVYHNASGVVGTQTAVGIDAQNIQPATLLEIDSHEAYQASLHHDLSSSSQSSSSIALILNQPQPQSSVGLANDLPSSSDRRDDANDGSTTTTATVILVESKESPSLPLGQ